MLEVIVRLEKRIASEKLDENASNAPNVARKTPSKTKDDFRSPVVPGRNDAGVIFIVKRSGAKVDQANLCIHQYPASAAGAGRGQ